MGKSVRHIGGSYPRIRAQGSPFALGHQHGAQCAALIQRFARVGLPKFLRCRPDEMEHLFSEPLGRYRNAVEVHAPHLFEEVRGVAAGSGIAVSEALLLQLRPELGYLRRRQPQGCTSIGVCARRSAAGVPLLGQNVDMPRELLDYGIVLELRPDTGPAILCWTLVGVVGQTGINSYGLGRCGNVLFSGSWRIGVPTAILFRLALELRRVSDVVDTCARLDRAKSNNFLLCDAEDGVASLEMTVDEQRLLGPDEDGFLVHANHYRHGDFTGTDDCPYLEASRLREARVSELLHEMPGQVSETDLRTMLSDHNNAPHSICGHGAPGLQTIASCVLNPLQGRLWVSRGNPCQSGYELYQLDASGGTWR